MVSHYPSQDQSHKKRHCLQSSSPPSLSRIQAMLSERYSLATLSDGIFTVKDLNYVPPLMIVHPPFKIKSS